MGGPLPFPSANVPILGQACKVHGWFPTVMLTCTCEAQTPLMLVGLAAVATCDGCGRHFTIGGLAHDQKTGNGYVNIAQVALPAAPTPS